MFIQRAGGETLDGPRVRVISVPLIREKNGQEIPRKTRSATGSNQTHGAFDFSGVHRQTRTGTGHGYIHANHLRPLDCGMHIVLQFVIEMSKVMHRPIGFCLSSLCILHVVYRHIKCSFLQAW